MRIPEDRLTEQDEILFRQVHPFFYQNGRISSQAFEAHPVSHKGLLSVDRESMITAQQSYELYTEGFKNQSACVCGVQLFEVESEGLFAYADEIERTYEHPANSAHAVVDMSELTRSKMKKIASRLARRARERGLLYEPA